VYRAITCVISKLLLHSDNNVCINYLSDVSVNYVLDNNSDYNNNDTKSSSTKSILTDCIESVHVLPIEGDV